MAIEVSVKIDLNLHCSECGEELEVTQNEDKYLVTPCITCGTRSYDMGFYFGQQDMIEAKDD